MSGETTSGGAAPAEAFEARLMALIREETGRRGDGGNWLGIIEAVSGLSTCLGVLIGQMVLRANHPDLSARDLAHQLVDIQVENIRGTVDDALADSGPDTKGSPQ
ncbi:hypothetical protein SAMN02745172_02491 [Pseudoxanthobacter soli DSM 19599]|uniref:Uncharacterized protein n=1 Tax=Pseudoxanthobacter soli DSM 19599 TaxID=1123029 RepID=A0A1M7ZLR9_9HYPH|nr:hypothetical protein [Pseudoxanthobacter soli]SHO65844.1 hypothetical protein SAMN02745172_02491 [Pseudoxanthobacter soli DSM 19599]